MTPDYQKAAITATETLIKFGINSAPVSALPILKNTPGVLVFSYQSISNHIDQDRRCVISMFGDGNQDAFTTVNMKDGKPQYIVTYNQQLSQVFVQRSLARELGHIILGHDGTLPEDVRNEEAKAFANHLLCPRPMIHAFQAAGLRITTEMLGNLTGCFDYCLSCMRRIPAVSVPAEMNRLVRDQFMDYIVNFIEYYRNATLTDGSALADFGSYMDGYEE
jgi:hypothetical protein